MTYLSDSDLLLVHNNLSSATVAEVRDRASMIVRVRGLLDAIELVLIEHPPLRVSGIAIRQFLWACPRGHLAETAVMANRDARYHPEDVIRLLVTANPKKAGTAAHARFALLRDGMTFAEYRQECVDHGLGSRRAPHDMTYGVEHGDIAVYRHDDPSIET